MTFTVESKSQLAKLMATENLTVEHQKIRTAKFDPLNRILYLPIWKDMTGAMQECCELVERQKQSLTPERGRRAEKSAEVAL